MSNQWLTCPKCEDVTFEFEVDVEKGYEQTETSPAEPTAFTAYPTATLCSNCGHELTSMEISKMEEDAIEMYKNDWIEQHEAHEYDYEED